MPFCSTRTSGFLEKSTLFMSTFHVPSKTLCAVAGLGINRAAGTKSKHSLFIASLHGVELRAKTISELAPTHWKCVCFAVSGPNKFGVLGENLLPRVFYSNVGCDRFRPVGLQFRAL